MMSAISVDGLSYSYGRRQVLSELTWAIPEGMTGLIGPNGAGKSTLIRCLVGLAQPDAGNITIRARDTAADTDRHRIGYVPQEADAPGRMKVQDIVEYCAWLHGVSGASTASAARSALSLLGLGSFAERRFRSLSGGERRRVMIAAGLAHGPAVLVLDEPTVGLDPGQRLAVRRAIASLDVQSVLLATHLVEDVEHLCVNVGILNHGRITYSGTTTGLLDIVEKARPDTNDRAYGSAFEHAYEQLLDGTASSTAGTPT